MVGFRDRVSEQAVRAALHAVRDPDINKPLDELGMLESVHIKGGDVRVGVLLTIAGCPLKAEIEARVRRALDPVAGVKRVEVTFGVMPEEQRANMVQGLRRGAPRRGSITAGGDIPFSRPDNRTTVIGISSGKGGVGKSTVTVNLAAALHALGHSVGVVDADIWGFSIPRMFGVRGRKPVAFNGMIMPLDRDGVKVMSFGLIVDSEETPVIFRGPMLHKALEQFLTDVYWQDDLEYLLVDLPPGTGDISLSLAQFLPGMAMVVVTTPQPVAQKVAERAANMAGRVNLRVLGVVENMSGVVCEHCGETTAIFGEGGGRELAGDLGVPLLAEIPLVPALRSDSDEGTPFVWVRPDHPVTQKFLELARQVASYRPKRRLPVTQTKRP